MKRPNSSRIRTHANPQNQNPRQRLTRPEVEAMLREIAFVLKMAQRVRDEMESERAIELASLEA